MHQYRAFDGPVLLRQHQTLNTEFRDVEREPNQATRNATLRQHVRTVNAAAKTLSDPAENMVGRMHAEAGDTETAAALDVFPESGSLRFRCCEALYNAGDMGLTDHELAEVTGIYYLTAEPRRNELCRSGWAMDSGLRRPSPLNKLCRCYVMTPEGRARWEAEMGAPKKDLD